MPPSKTKKFNWQPIKLAHHREQRRYYHRAIFHHQWNSKKSLLMLCDIFEESITTVQSKILSNSKKYFVTQFCAFAQNSATNWHPPGLLNTRSSVRNPPIYLSTSKLGRRMFYPQHLRTPITNIRTTRILMKILTNRILTKTSFLRMMRMLRMHFT